LNDESNVPAVAVKRGPKAGNPKTKLAQAKALYASCLANGLTKRKQVLPILEKDLELSHNVASLYFHFAQTAHAKALEANAAQVAVFTEAVAEAAVETV
jgi:hypothetical protein